MAGDAFLEALGGPYELALVTNVVHPFGEEREVELLTVSQLRCIQTGASLSSTSCRTRHPRSRAA